MYPTIFDTDEINALRDLARKFARDRLAPGYQAREKSGAFGPELVREMGSLGLIAPELPEEFGGLGSGALYSGVIIEEIARGDFNMGYINVLASLNGQILAKFATPRSSGNGCRSSSQAN
ncbi:acyl-CoA dehydrogenase family protein [Ochrobactrum sp. P6BS-III]|uniref:acyl-CoA dehydrogenase family protein n=1 Tax=Ochrobactrum sp. P6BS-III TaxID=1920636 RepID=UPI002681ABA5